MTTKKSSEKKATRKEKWTAIGSLTILVLLLGSSGYLIYYFYYPASDDSFITHNGISDGFLVSVYHPLYQWDDIEMADIPWEYITNLVLGYLHLTQDIDNDYTLKAPDGFSMSLNDWLDEAQLYITEAHSNNVTVCCMLGGAGSNPGSIWNTATSSSNIGAFSQNIEDLLTSVGFDGVDLDWEDSVDYPQLVDLSKNIRERWSDAIISIPTGPTGSDAALFAPASAYVDMFCPMSYISWQQWGGWMIPIPLTPLYGAERDGYNTNPLSINLTLQRWLAEGVPASKIVLGSGGFGSVWGDSNGDGIAPIEPYSNADINGAAFTETRSIASDNAVTWSWVKTTTETHPELTLAWDDFGKCNYWHAPAVDNLVTAPNRYGTNIDIGIIFYETPRSINEKVLFCQENDMLGMFFWTLSQMMDGSSCPNLEAITT